MYKKKPVAMCAHRMKIHPIKSHFYVSACNVIMILLIIYYTSNH